MAEEVNWSEYFASIVSVCPWSKAYWRAQKIDVVDWNNQVIPLDQYVARIYRTEMTARQLYNTARKHNKLYEDEEWLYSHPKFGGHSTPIPVLIQQDYAVLAKARDSINTTNNRKIGS